jgi:hypothetical protein
LSPPAGGGGKAGGIPQQPSVGGSRSEPFSHAGSGYSYDDYDPATNTVRHNQSGIAGNIDMGRVSVADLMNPENVRARSKPFDPAKGPQFSFDPRGTYYDEGFASAFNQYQNQAQPAASPMPAGGGVADGAQMPSQDYMRMLRDFQTQGGSVGENATKKLAEAQAIIDANQSQPVAGSGGNQQQQQQQAPNINQSAARGIQGAMAGAAREMNYRPMNVRSPGYQATQTGAQGYGAAQAGARGFQGADVGATGYGASQAGATGFGAADVGSQGFQAAGLGAQGYGAERAGATGFQAAGLGAQGYDAARTGATGFGAERLGGAPTVTSRDVTAGQLAGTDLSQYYNPYESQVVQSTLSDLDRARQISMGQAGAQASAAGAFGGSRQALMEAETNRAFAEQAARSAGQLRQAGFTQAQGMAQQDIAGRMQASLANQQAGLQAGTTSANLAQQAALANQAAGMRAGEFSASAANQAALANQAAQNQARQFSAQAGNVAGAQASAQQQAASQFGASAANQSIWRICCQSGCSC